MPQTERIAISELPAFMAPAHDGIVGWRTISRNVVLFDAQRMRVAFLPRVPEDALGWERLEVSPDHERLVLEAPGVSGPDNLILVDSGIWSGVGMGPRRWHQWSEAHPDSPRTLSLGYTEFAGTVVREQGWADECRLGPVELTDVIVEQDTGVGLLIGEGHLATWGMSALKRLILVVDGENKVAYVKPSADPGDPGGHNRLGAVFMPSGVEGQGPVARVVAGGPAFEAGLRDGDVLLRFGVNDATNWTQVGMVAGSMGQPRFLPAGTHVNVTVKRGDQEFTTMIVLRDILGPSGSSAGFR